jgi:hypothetical protein
MWRCLAARKKRSRAPRTVLGERPDTGVIIHWCFLFGLAAWQFASASKLQVEPYPLSLHALLADGAIVFNSVIQSFEELVTVRDRT